MFQGFVAEIVGFKGEEPLIFNAVFSTLKRQYVCIREV